MRKFAPLVFATLSAAALGAAAYAAPTPAASGAPRHGGPRHLGPVTRAEAQSRADALFARLDANGDGVIDARDRQARQAERFARLDTDHNGSLSPQEFAAAAPGPRGPVGAFAGKPGDRPAAPDGPPPAGFEGRHMGKRGPMGLAGRHGGFGGPGKLVREADVNHDGTISKAEFEAFSLARFDAADTNHDGTVSADERKAAMKAARGELRGQWRARHDAASDVDQQNQ